MAFEISRSSSYMPVKDMKRAIRFYQKLFSRKVDVRDKNLSVFDFGDFKFCLKKADEEVDGEDRYLLSFDVADREEFYKMTRININKRPMPPAALVRIEGGWIFEVKDSEGNDIKIYWRA